MRIPPSRCRTTIRSLKACPREAGAAALARRALPSAAAACGVACWMLLMHAALSMPQAWAAESGSHGDGSVSISDQPMQWHKVTLTVDGPFAREQDDDPNPFLDYRLMVTFAHESGQPVYHVPGYFAADGEAAETSAEAGRCWRAHLSPDKPGRWTYRVSFVQGEQVAIDPERAGQAVAGCDGRQGEFQVAATDKTGRDLRGAGRLEYVGRHHLRFAGSGRYFLKAGPDSPETLLAYEDFDGTRAGRKKPARPGEAAPTGGLHRFQPHLRDWRDGDPTWKDGRGKALIGALNYLAGKGCNAFSFMPYNAGGDGDNVWPFRDREDKLHYDCSKLDQWQIVFDHAQSLGLYLHFKLQETEIDDNRHGNSRTPVPTALDGGQLGVERKLYCRELIARFAHELALNWNLGEENTQSADEQRAMAGYLRDVDPYDHHRVVHTYPGAQDQVYTPLLGDQSALTGVSLQNSWQAAHQRTLRWIRASAEAGVPWVVANDEQNPADMGVPPDPGYAGNNGLAQDGKRTYDLHDIRKLTLWGTLMGGGAGVEYYFGYRLPQNDLGCDDWRSRDRSWDYCRIAIEFFQNSGIPFWEMHNADASVGNPKNENRRFCLAKPGQIYLVYLPEGGTAELDLSDAAGTFQVEWFDARNGGPLRQGSVRQVTGGAKVDLGTAPDEPQEDWAILVRK